MPRHKMTELESTLRTWDEVTRLYHEKTGERLCRRTVQKIADTAIAKMRKEMNIQIKESR